MGKLFKIEMKKLQKSTAMKVMIIVAAGLGVLSVALNVLLDYLAEGLVEMALGLSGVNMAEAMSYGDSDILLMVTILMAVLIGGDFSARTLQTQVAAGYGRFTIILSRFISGVISYTILYVEYCLIIIGGITIFYGWGEDITSNEGLKHLGEIAAQFGLGYLLAITFLAIYMLFMFLLKNVGGSIGVCVPTMLFVPTILQTVMIFNDDAAEVMSFTPIGQQYEFTMSVYGNGLADVDIVRFILVCLVWLVAFIGLNFLTFRKSELK